MEKNRQKADLIKEVVDENGEKKKGTEEILLTVKLFYEDMFKGRGIDKKEEEFCLNQIKVKFWRKIMFYVMLRYQKMYLI